MPAITLLPVAEQRESFCERGVLWFGEAAVTGTAFCSLGISTVKLCWQDNYTAPVQLGWESRSIKSGLPSVLRTAHK